MAHRLLPGIMEDSKQKLFSVKMPAMSGKFGFSLFVGKKELFIGLAIADVTVEEVVRKRLVNKPKAGVRVLRFD